MGHMIEIRCCVCGKHMGEKKGDQETNTISHGYCDDCFDNCFADFKIELNQLFKDKISKDTAYIN